MFDLGLANLELAYRVEVDFVDRTAGSYKSYEHRVSGHCGAK
jgi:hypothetical protein